MNVVVLSDEPVLAELVRRPLEPLGHKVSAVTSAAELTSRLDELDPRAALLPRRLPDAELAEVVAILRKRATPIAAILVGVAPADRAIARDVDADGFLLVPFADAEILDVVGATTRARKLILLADDSPLIHRHTVPILEDEGYQVISAYDGAEALELVSARMPDLVITDVEMPKLDGYAVCAGIKGHPDTAHLPVMISSTLGAAADLERGFEAGADDYLVKPVVPMELVTRVKALFTSSIPASRERILVVHDSPAQRHYVADCLARQGFEISTAENGKIALEKAQALRPALVVSDYEMPVMTGFELVHALRRDPELRQIPVIMLTARDARRDVAQMRAAGVSAYLVKPFSQDKCIAMVERALAERRLLASSLFIPDATHGVRADEQTLAILFSDLVGFTPLSASLSPRALIELLNDYFDIMCPIVKDEGGDIDKFIGDAIMAVFAEERGRAPAPERAVRAALAMQAAMPVFNAGIAIDLRMRIGVNTGPVVRGDLGSKVVRRDYTVIGDTVNQANRYQATCPPGEVLVCQSTRDALGERAQVRTIGGLELEGVAQPVQAYVVEALAPRQEYS